MFRRLAAAVALAITGLALAPQTARAEAPTIGQCHQLSNAVLDAASDPTAPVPCAGPHNTLTVAVVDSTVPLDGFTDMTVTTLASRACYPAYWQALGGTPSQQGLSDFAMVLFVPTAAERAAGARWFRCDAVLMNGHSVAAMPALGSPVLTQPLPRSLQRCIDGRHLSVPCTRSHIYRAFKVFRLSRGGSSRAIYAQARQHCRGVAWVAWDDGPGWALGDHWATCFARTAR